MHDNKRQLNFFDKCNSFLCLFWYCTKVFPRSSKFSSHKDVALAMVKHKYVGNSRKMSAISALNKIQQVVHFPENYQQLISSYWNAPKTLSSELSNFCNTCFPQSFWINPSFLQITTETTLRDIQWKSIRRSHYIVYTNARSRKFPGKLVIVFYWIESLN